MSSIGRPNFQIQAPQRVVKQAQQYRDLLADTILFPTSVNKSMYIEKIAEYDFDSIKFSIDRAKYQNTLFRKLQKIDRHNRKKVSQSLLIRSNKVEQNVSQIYEKQHKKHEFYQKHVVEVQKRYDEQERKKFNQEKQEAIKLRKELKQFYEKQELKKKTAHQKQAKVQTCYSNALERIHRIQRKNQQFSLKAELDLQKSFAINSPDKKANLTSLRSTSLDFKKVSKNQIQKQQVYEFSQDILKEKQAKFIQKMGRNETSSLKAFQFKETENEKVKKRISERLKKETQRWAQLKKRVDEQNAQVPEKCTSKLQKSLQSTFRHTFSTFKDSFTTWRNTGELNRLKIKERVDRRKDEIIQNHQDTTRRNKGTKEVDTTMLSMKQRASKLAQNYL